MTKEQKEAFVDEVRNRVQNAEAVYLTDFTGLDVKDMTRLRSQLRSAGSEYVVVKNRLLKRALEGLDFPDLSEHLVGPTGILFGTSGVVEPAKAVADFAKEHYDKPVFKVGVVENEILDATEIARLAKLPSREVLFSQLAGALGGPMSALASALEAKIQEFVGLLDALQQEKS